MNKTMTDRMKIVFLDAYTMGDDISFEGLKKYGDVKLYDTTSPEQVNERIAGYDIVITNKVQVRRANIDSDSALKLICVAATGVNNIDVEYAESKGIAVKNVAGYSTESVAQVTFMLILNLICHGSYFDTYVKSGNYYRSGTFTDASKSFFELKGKRLGIIGMGNIGQRVAAIASAFGMNVSYFSTSGSSHCTEYPSVGIEELLSQSDIVSVHAPMNDRTRNLITYDRLAMMKPTAYLVNTGRGGIVNEAELVRALNDGLLAGAGIDVFEQEPLPLNHPYVSGLTDPSRIFLTPHIGWASREARTLLMEKICGNIEEFLR